ncbi:radical SAM protein [Lutispora sp.]|uniref:radical SAM protein n=1 Tax=Lutispora sp. TaxID=2828727 RepID=UPI0035663D77
MVFISLLYEEYSIWKGVHFIDRLNKIKAEGICDPVSLQISLTNLCNNNCFYCYVSEQNKLKESLDTDVVLRLLNEAKKMNVKSVEITGGGEPTLHRDFDIIVRKINELELELGLVTNGFHIVPEDLNFATWVRISIDSFNSETYKRIRKADMPDLKPIEVLCRNSKVAVGASCVITPYNYTSLYEFAKTAKEIGFKNVWFKPVKINGSSKIIDGYKEVCLKQFEDTMNLVDDNFKVFYPSFNGNRGANNNKCFRRCIQQHLSAFVWSNGDLYPCCSLQGFKDMCIGNINRNSFIEQWNNRKIIEPNECFLRCFWEEKNIFLNYIMLDNPPHVNFV